MQRQRVIVYGPIRVNKQRIDDQPPPKLNFDRDCIEVLVQPPQLVFQEGRASGVLAPGPHNKDRYHVRDLAVRPQSAPTRRPDSIEICLRRPVLANPLKPPSVDAPAQPPMTRPRSAPVRSPKIGTHIYSHPAYVARKFLWSETLRDFRSCEKFPIMSRKRRHLRTYVDHLPW